MDNKLEKFASTLRKFRKDKDITQREAASMLNISANYYGELERGEKLPSVDLLYYIAEKYSINVIEFFEDKNANNDSLKQNNPESLDNGTEKSSSGINNERLEIYYSQLLKLKDEIIASKDDSIESKNQLITELRNEIKRNKE